MPFVLFLLALASIVIAVARPVTTLGASSNQSTVMLALDVSLSMCASDIFPNRLAAAKTAAESFIGNQKKDTLIGIVPFAGLAELSLSPTRDRESAVDAVDSLTVGRSTAIGSAIVRSIDAIAEANESVASARQYIDRSGQGPISQLESNQQADIIVLLTDGSSNRGVPPDRAALAAVERGIPVYTIGFGTDRGSPLECTSQQLGGLDISDLLGRRSSGFGPGSSTAQSFQVELDEDTLKEVAELTDAEYYKAESVNELQSVFEDIPANLVKSEVRTEITVIFAGIGGLIALVAVALSIRWRPLP